MTARTTDTRTLLDCPACTEPIAADLVFDVKLTPIAEKSEGEPLSLRQASATAFLELAGVHISHDCMPKATRYASGGDTRKGETS